MYGVYVCMGCSCPGTGGGGCRAASVRRGQGCPMPDTAPSSWLQPTHRRARLSPAATGGCLRESPCKKGQKTLDKERNNIGNTKVRGGPFPSVSIGFLLV